MSYYRYSPESSCFRSNQTHSIKYLLGTLEEHGIGLDDIVSSLDIIAQEYLNQDGAIGSSPVALAAPVADGVRSLSLKMGEVADVGVVGEWNAPGNALVRDMNVSSKRASCWLAGLLVLILPVHSGR